MAQNTLTVAGTIITGTGSEGIQYQITNTTPPLGSETSINASGTTNITVPANAIGFVINSTLTAGPASFTVAGVAMPLICQGAVPINSAVLTTLTVIVGAGYAAGSVSIKFY